jgi:3-methyladenine DNA glycosylase AlkD
VTLAVDLMERLEREHEAARNPEAAGPMVAYMRNQFSYLGIRAPEQQRIFRSVTAGLPGPAGDADLAAVVLACWERPEREYQYFGASYVRKHVGRASLGFVPTLERLIATKSWWDTVDTLAVHVAGPLVLRSPELRAVTDRWLESDDIWLARTAILHQQRYGARTDPEVLFAYCLRRAADREFFIRKAIGWALRSYAKLAPDAVAGFLAAHGDRLSGLSLREARRGVERAILDAPIATARIDS